MNRRDLLKYFAAGTVIAPLTGETVAARLIEPPRVELVKPEIATVVDLANITRLTVSMQFRDGSTMALNFDEAQLRNGIHEGKVHQSQYGRFGVAMTINSDATVSPLTTATAHLNAYTGYRW